MWTIPHAFLFLRSKMPIHLFDSLLRRHSEKTASLPLQTSESAAACAECGSAEAFADALLENDVISFDIFGTLILRPFSEPSDLFYFLSREIGVLNFHTIRKELEAKSRRIRETKENDRQVTLDEIWYRIEAETAVNASFGEETEKWLERTFCFANPFMLDIFALVKEAGKTIVAVSDMYLPSGFLKDLLTDLGFDGIERVFVSCEERKSKQDGSLYDAVKEAYPGKTIIHVGDEMQGDSEIPKKHGISSKLYPNVHRYAADYRSFDMSPLIGSAYRGIVDTWLYNGKTQYNRPYEFGFIYGGLFAIGYCHFIHQYCLANNVFRILFLARDGDILQKVYEKMYPDEKTHYVYWSGIAAHKLMAFYDRYNYYQEFLYKKVSLGITVRQTLEEMELVSLIDLLTEEADGHTPQPDDILTAANAEAVRAFLHMHTDDILACYEEHLLMAKAYYENELQDAKKAVIVDIGWLGSGAMALSYMAEHVWKIPCALTGIIAGTNTMSSQFPDAAEPFLASGKLVPYMYSLSLNRDIMLRHDPGKRYNDYWELLVSSPTPSFLGFASPLVFGEPDPNPEGIMDIQLGILDFVEQYLHHFRNFPFMTDIKGRDTYAPMLRAAADDEAYLKMIAGLLEEKKD